jgi:UDP-N-acetylglucosamine 1-carboxyvinyltransferase
MDVFQIQGPVSLDGTIYVSGSKNSALPIMAAALLTPGRTTIPNAPYLSDIRSMGELLRQIGCLVHIEEGSPTTIDATVIDKPFGDYDLVRKMRASICVLGPLLARGGRVEISMPGGCAIGDRPIDIHLRAMRELGATITLKNGYVIAEAPNGLQGAEIFMGGSFGSTVLGTDNAMMAATLAKGTTVLESAACEPEVVDLANCLNKMGAKISGIGSPRLTIEGVESLHPVEYAVIPDRIEAGTFMLGAAITHGRLKIPNCRMRDLMAVVDKLRHIGVTVESMNGGCEVSMPRGQVRAADITTQPHPGFPTDLQAQFMTLLALGDGNSIITEKIYPDRFLHVAELTRMGANLRKEGPSVIVCGTDKLMAAPVMASDLRASAALVLAGLAAEGTTTVNRVYHIDRGYEKIEEKLNAVGGHITREKSKPSTAAGAESPEGELVISGS